MKALIRHEWWWLWQQWLHITYIILQIKIYAPPGTPIGYVIQTKHPYVPKFTIQNENKKDMLRIIGPFFACKCCGDVDFEVRDMIIFIRFEVRDVIIFIGFPYIFQM